MSKSKSYLLSDEKSVKKRISFGFTNKTVHDKSVSFDNDSNCVLKKVNSHEFLDEIINEESSRQINESSDLEKVVSFFFHLTWQIRNQKPKFEINLLKKKTIKSLKYFYSNLFGLIKQRICSHDNLVRISHVYKKSQARQ